MRVLRLYFLILSLAALFSCAVFTGPYGSSPEDEEIIPHTVSFDKNHAEATGAMSPQIIGENKTVRLKANQFVRDDYYFWGWAETAGGAVVYQDSGLYTMGTEDVVLYAVWYSVGKTWTQTTVNAGFSARLDHTSVVFDSKMWVIGGFDGTFKSDVWYSEDGINWTQATANAGFSARRGHTSVVFNGEIWVIGGIDGSYKNDVWSSSDGVNWTEVKPHVSDPPDGTHFAARKDHTSVVYDNKMWVIGGTNGTSLYNVWYSENGESWTRAAQIEGFPARYAHTSLVFDNKMWIMGGSGTSRMNDVRFSADGTSWTTATAGAGFTARSGHASVVFDNKIWVIGGIDSTDKNDVWFSVDGVGWTKATAGAGFTARSGHSSVVFDNKIWVIGGYDGSYKNDVWWSY